MVLGGGVIGVEFASVWRSFGADVQIVEALPRLVPNEDEALSKALERAFRKRGIAFSLGDRFAGVKETDSGVTVTLESGPSAEIAGLVVDEETRGAGVGARLVAEAEAWAAGAGFARMRVRSNVKRNRARRFYERAGFVVTKRQRNFEKALEGSPNRA